MKSILKLLVKYRADVTIVAVYGIAAIIFTLLIYMFIKKKSIKYIFNLILIVSGFVLLYMGYRNILKSNGLTQIKYAIKLLTFSGVGFLFSIVLDLMDSIFSKSKKKIGGKKEKESKKETLNKKDLVLDFDKGLKKDRIEKNLDQTKNFYTKEKRGDDGLTKVVPKLNKDQLEDEKYKPILKDLQKDKKLAYKRDVLKDNKSKVGFKDNLSKFWTRLIIKSKELFSLVKMNMKKLAKKTGIVFKKIKAKIKSLFKQK